MLAPTTRRTITIVLITLLTLIALFILTAPDKRNPAERIGDAISALPDGADKAADQLEDRSPAQRIGDALEDAGENAKRNVNEE